MKHNILPKFSRSFYSTGVCLPIMSVPLFSFVRICMIIMCVSIVWFGAGVECRASEFAGEFQDVQGTVLLDRGDGWVKVISGFPVEHGDRVKTSAESACSIGLDDGSVISVTENTEAVIEDLNITQESHASRVSLLVGKLLASIAKLKETKMIIRTPTAVCAVRGTEFAVEASSGTAAVGVFSGMVAVSNPDSLADEIIVQGDEETTVAIGMRPQRPAKLQAAMIRNRERMAGIRLSVAELRERLKRVPPDKRKELRKRIIDRYGALRKKHRGTEQVLDRRKSGRIAADELNNKGR